jgi:predicted Zn-dependent protease
LALPHRLIQDGRLGEALAELQRLSVERPQDAAVWRALGQLQWQMGQKPQALAALRMSHSLYPDPGLAAWLQQVDAVLQPPGNPEKP